MKGTGIEEIGLVVSIASLHFTIDTTEYETTSHKGILLWSVMRQRRDLCWRKATMRHTQATRLTDDRYLEVECLKVRRQEWVRETFFQCTIYFAPAFELDCHWCAPSLAFAFESNDVWLWYVWFSLFRLLAREVLCRNHPEVKQSSPTRNHWFHWADHDDPSLDKQSLETPNPAIEKTFASVQQKEERSLPVCWRVYSDSGRFRSILPLLDPSVEREISRVMGLQSYCLNEDETERMIGSKDHHHPYLAIDLLKDERRPWQAGLNGE